MSYNKSATCSAPLLAARKSGPFTLGNRGFTLVELIAVCAILTVLTFLAIPTYGKIKDKVRSVRAMEEIRGLEKGIIAYSVDKNGVFPDKLATAGLGTLTDVPKDPWGNPYVYHVRGDGDPRTISVALTTPLNDDFDLYSAGADGLTDADIGTAASSDDIVRSGDGGYVGYANGLLLGD